MESKCFQITIEMHDETKYTFDLILGKIFNIMYEYVENDPVIISRSIDVCEYVQNTPPWELGTVRDTKSTDG